MWGIPKSTDLKTKACVSNDGASGFADFVFGKTHVHNAIEKVTKVSCFGTFGSVKLRGANCVVHFMKHSTLEERRIA